MYTEHFGLTEKPFSISPDPRYLYLSQRHADALAHLIYGISESGGFIQLTGEVGTGKTTLIRSLLEQLPDKTEIALVLNPPLTTREFLSAICQELRIQLPPVQTVKSLIDRLNDRLLAAHAEDRRIVLIVDEAQTLSPELLEQIRLLTNLETSKRKLLQIILIGQPELRVLLDRPEMRQIAQRITGRYHLEPLTAHDTKIYIRHRMRVAGSHSDVFTERAMRGLYRKSGGVPRLINVIADRALLAAYTLDERAIGGALVRKAAQEVFGRQTVQRWAWAGSTFAGILAAVLLGILFWPSGPSGDNGSTAAAQTPYSDEIISVAFAADAATPAANVGGENPVSGPGDATLAAPLSSASPAETGLASIGVFLAENVGLTDEDSAARELFALWGAGFRSSRAESCIQAVSTGLQCLNMSDSTLSDLRQIDRPMVIELDDTEGGAHHVVMTALGYDYAEVSAGDDTTRVSIADLSHYWYGEHWLLWRPLTDVTISLRPGMRGERVVWLREALETIRGNDGPIEPFSPSEPADALFYDPALERRVREYQLSKRLGVDGVVGARTQIALQTDLGHRAGPTLAGAR